MTIHVLEHGANVGGIWVPLNSAERKLIRKLASTPGRVFTKEELMRAVWRREEEGRTRTLDSMALRLNQHLVTAGARAKVVNVWGVGYRLEEVQPAGRGMPAGIARLYALLDAAERDGRKRDADDLRQALANREA